MITNNISTLTDPQNGNLAFRIFPFTNGNPFDHIQRLNYHSLVLIFDGEAKLKADFAEYLIQQSCLLYFSPFQPFMLSSANNIHGICINFHSDFFCIHKHYHEVACNGVLFNNIYHHPFILLTESELKDFGQLIDHMKEEMQRGKQAERELLISYLKIILINATRIKMSQLPDKVNEMPEGSEHFIIQKLKDAIEKHFRSKHSPKDYAHLLHVPANTLAKISKSHFNKPLTDLIAERVIIEAKRDLYLTSKPVKQIANDLGFSDEYYFSRFFKNNTEISPKQYRETVGFAKAETN